MVAGHVIGSKTFRALRNQDLLEPNQDGEYVLTRRGRWAAGLPDLGDPSVPFLTLRPLDLVKQDLLKGQRQ
jgi:hypothetical protein